MKLICKKQYKILEGIFDVNDIVELEQLYEEEDIYDTRVIYITKADSKGKAYRTSLIEKYIKKEKGSYKGFRLKSKNGNYYDEGCLKNYIGYKPLSDLFQKVL